MTEIELNIREWAREKGIYDKSDDFLQALKAQEEIKELIFELHKKKRLMQKEKAPLEDFLEANEKSLMEAGDVLVCMVSVCHLLGSSLESCMERAYEKIKDRNGTMVDGQFVKKAE